MSKWTDNFKGKCVSCIFFQNGYKKGVGYCIGNTRAYKEVFGKSWRAGAPEGPSFEVKKLSGCREWQGV